jgi:hypothetical protein
LRPLSFGIKHLRRLSPFWDTLAEVSRIRKQAHATAQKHLVQSNAAATQTSGSNLTPELTNLRQARRATAGFNTPLHGFSRASDNLLITKTGH